MRSISVWISLLLVSLIIHILLSWQGARTVLAPAPGADNTSEVQINLDAVAAPPAEEKTPEEKAKLVFEDAIEFEPPPVLVPSAAVAPPPPDVNLAMEAAAGDKTPAGKPALSGYGGTSFTLPLLADGNATGTAGQGQAGFGTGIGNGLSNSTNRFAAYVQGLRETGLDVVFVVDSTGSMDWVLKEVRGRIVDIVDAIRLLVPISRFGVVVYRDVGSPEYVTRIQPLTFSLSKLSGFLGSVKAEGGGDLAEALDQGLRVAIEQGGWRMGAKKVIIIVGDAPPHDDTLRHLLATLKEFAAGGGEVSTLDVSHDGNPAVVEASVGRKVNWVLYRNKPMLMFQQIAEAGGGVATTLEGEVRITRQLVSLIMGGQFAAEMALLLEGL
ncbi:MAG: vWA domain-containing protein [Porticoccaceae bacterium]